MSPNERRPEIELSEADYLAREIVDAKRALSHALVDLKSGLADSADLRRWVKRYPWAVLGAAAATGFATAAAVTPARGESIKDKLARLRPDGQSPSADRRCSPPPKVEQSETLTVTDKLLSSLFDVAKVLVQTLIVTAFQRPAASEVSASVDEERRATSMAK
jgi:hypothetical protein